MGNFKQVDFWGLESWWTPFFFGRKNDRLLAQINHVTTSAMNHVRLDSMWRPPLSWVGLLHKIIGGNTVPSQCSTWKLMVGKDQFHFGTPARSLSGANVRFSEVYFPQWFCKRKVLWKDSSRKLICERFQRSQQKAVVEHVVLFHSLRFFVGFFVKLGLFFSELRKSQKRFWFWWPSLRVFFLRQKWWTLPPLDRFFFQAFSRSCQTWGSACPMERAGELFDGRFFCFFFFRKSHSCKLT